MPYKSPEDKRAYSLRYYVEHRERIKERSRRWHKDHPGRQQESARKWQAAHPEQYRAAIKQWQIAHPESYRNGRYKKKYGITLEDYDRMLLDQGGVCAICSRSPGQRRLHVDHAHGTGEVRGLLCIRCNNALGVIEDPLYANYKAYLGIA